MTSMISLLYPQILSTTQVIPRALRAAEVVCCTCRLLNFAAVRACAFDCRRSAEGAPRFARPSGRCRVGRFAARISGLASGLALAVRPAGSAEVSGAQGWVPEIVSAERLETISGCP